MALASCPTMKIMMGWARRHGHRHKHSGAGPMVAVQRSGWFPTATATTISSSSACRRQPPQVLHGRRYAHLGGHQSGSDGRCFSTSGHATAREIAEQLQRAEEQKEAAFGRNDFAALPGLHEEVERLTELLQQTELAGKVDIREREELERSQQERLSQLRADAEHAASSAQAAVRDKLMAAGLGGTTAELAQADAIAKSLAEAAGESEFWAVEQLAWGDADVADVYQQSFNSLTRQCVPALLDGVGCGAGTRLLDVATGPGYVLLSALDRGAMCAGVDFSKSMLDLAQTNIDDHVAKAKADGGTSALPAVMLLPGDAQALPFQQSAVDESGGLFDAVVCNFGVLHLGEPQKFFKEAFRVLRPGGKLGFTVWCAPPQTEGFAITLGAIAERGDPNVELPAGPPFFYYSDPAAAAGHLEKAGFAEGGTETTIVSQEWALPSCGGLWQAMSGGTARTRATIAAQTPSAQKAIEEAMRKACADRASAGGQVTLQMPCVLTVATKPC